MRQLLLTALMFSPLAFGQALLANSVPIPSSESAESLRVMRAQEAIVEVADRLAEHVSSSAKLDKRYDVGFAAIELDVPKEAVKLFWKRSAVVPDELLKLVRNQKVDVRFEESPFSAIEVRSQISLLVQNFRATNSAWSSVGPLSGGRGVRVTLLSDSGYRKKIERDGIELKTITAELSTIATMPGEFIKVDTAPPIVLTSRQADSSPWWGGAEIIGSGARCSSGFAIGDVWGVGMLTAAHCLPLNDGFAVNNGAGQAMGTSAHSGLWGSGSLDTVRINNVSAVQGKIYDGVPVVQEFSKPIKGAGYSSYVGLWLCVSGAFSGARCDIVVDSVENTNSTIDMNILDHLAYAHQVSGTCAIGDGDSGGPVFSLRDNNANATAQGTVVGSLFGFGTGCSGIVNINGVARSCSSQMVYLPIRYALDFHAAYITTY